MPQNLYGAINPLSANFTKWSNTLKQFFGKLPTNCLSVFDHFLKLGLKRLKHIKQKSLPNKNNSINNWNSTLWNRSILVVIIQLNLKVACVVDLKLAFTDCFFYNLIILIKLYKIWYLNLGKALLFPRNQVIYLKNKFWLQHFWKNFGFNIFLLKFCTRFLLNNV